VDDLHRRRLDCPDVCLRDRSQGRSRRTRRARSSTGSSRHSPWPGCLSRSTSSRSWPCWSSPTGSAGSPVGDRRFEHRQLLEPGVLPERPRTRRVTGLRVHDHRDRIAGTGDAREQHPGARAGLRRGGATPGSLGHSHFDPLRRPERHPPDVHRLPAPARLPAGRDHHPRVHLQLPWTPGTTCSRASTPTTTR